MTYLSDGLAMELTASNRSHQRSCACAARVLTALAALRGVRPLAQGMPEGAHVARGGGGSFTYRSPFLLDSINSHKSRQSHQKPTQFNRLSADGFIDGLTACPRNEAPLVLGPWPPACAARIVGPLVANAGRSERRAPCARPTHSRRTRPWQACVPAAKRAAAQAAWPVDRLSTWHEPNGPAFTGLNGCLRALYPGKNQGTRACPSGLSAAQRFFKSLTALTNSDLPPAKSPFGRRPRPVPWVLAPGKEGPPVIGRRAGADFRKISGKRRKIP